MTALHTVKSRIYPMDMSRDECPVVFSNPGNPAGFKKAWAKMERILKGMPVSTVDVLKDLKKTRESRGRL